MHGVGVSCVNALSKFLKAEIYRDGLIYVQEYSCGKAQSKIKTIGKTDLTGTKITFVPDDSIFTTTDYKFEILVTRLRELAFLNKGIKLAITDKREKDENDAYHTQNFLSEEGLQEFVEYLDVTRDRLTEKVLYTETIKNDVEKKD